MADPRLQSIIDLVAEDEPIQKQAPLGGPVTEPINLPTDIASIMQSRGSMAPFLVSKQDIGTLGHLKAGLKAGAYGELDFLDKAADWVSKVTGTEKGGAFASLKEAVKPEDYEMDDTSLAATVLRAVGMLPVQLAGALLAGGMGGGILKLARLPGAVKLLGRSVGMAAPLGFGLMGAAKEAVQPEADIGKVAKGAGIGAGMGVGLGLLHPSRALVRIPGSAGIFGGLTALEGGTPEETIAQTMVGGILGIPGGKPKIPAVGVAEAEVAPTGPLPGTQMTLPLRERVPVPTAAGPQMGLGLFSTGGVVRPGMPPVMPTLPKAIPLKTETARPSPEALYTTRNEIIDNLVIKKDFRRSVLEQLPDAILKWLAMSKTIKGNQVQFDPTTKSVMKRQGRRTRVDLMRDVALIDESNQTMSMERFNQLATELKARQLRDLAIGKDRVDLINETSIQRPGAPAPVTPVTPSEVPPITTPGVPPEPKDIISIISEGIKTQPEAGTVLAEGSQGPVIYRPDPQRIQIMIQNAYKDITTQFPKKELTVDDFMHIARDKYQIAPENRLELLKLINLEGWKVRGSGETLDALVGKKAQEKMAQGESEADQFAKLSVEEQKTSMAQEWETISDKYIDSAVKEGILPGKERFDKLPISAKEDITDLLDEIYEFKGEIVALKAQKKFDKKTENSYARKMGQRKGEINGIIRRSEGPIISAGEIATTLTTEELQSVNITAFKGETKVRPKKGAPPWEGRPVVEIVQPALDPKIYKQGDAVVDLMGSGITGVVVKKDANSLFIYSAIEDKAYKISSKPTKPGGPSPKKVETTMQPLATEAAIDKIVEAGKEPVEKVTPPAVSAVEEAGIKLEAQTIRDKFKDRPNADAMSVVYERYRKQGYGVTDAGKLAAKEVGWSIVKTPERKTGIITKKGEPTIEELAVEARERLEKQLGHTEEAREAKATQLQKEVEAEATRRTAIVEEETPGAGILESLAREGKGIDKGVARLVSVTDPEEVTGIKLETESIKEKYSSRPNVNKFAESFEKSRLSGMNMSEAAKKAAGEAGWAIKEEVPKPGKGKKEKTVSKLEKEIEKEYEALKAAAAREAVDKGLTDLDALQYVTNRLMRPEISQYFTNRRKGMNLSEAIAKLKDSQTPRVVLRKSTGEERIISNKQAIEFAAKVNEQAGKTLETAIKMGADPEIAQQLMETKVPEAQPDVVPRPVGMEHLPNPNEIFISAMFKPAKLAEGLPNIQANVKKLTDALSRSITAADAFRKERDRATDPTKRLDYDAKFRGQSNLKSQLVSELNEYMAAAKYLDERMKLAPEGFKVEKRFQDERGGHMIVSQKLPGGDKFYLLQDERGHAPNLQSAVKYGANAELIELKDEVQIKTFNNEKGLDPRFAAQLYDAIKEKYMMGDKPKRVVSSMAGRSSELHELAKDKDANDLSAAGGHDEKTMASVDRKGAYQEESILNRLYYSLRGYSGEREEYRTGMRAAREIKYSMDPMMLTTELRKSPTKDDMVPIADILGDPTQSKNPMIAWVAGQAKQQESRMAFYIKAATEYLDKNIGWTKADKAANRELLHHMHNIRKSNDPRILEAAKHIRAVEDDIASMFDLEKRGLYRKDHFGLIIDREKAWNFFSQPIALANDFGELPARVQAAITASNWPRAKYLADKFKSWEKVPKDDKAWIEDTVFPWGGIFGDWMKAPAFMQKMLPKEKWVKFFQERKSNLEFLAKEDVWDSMMIYLHTAVRGGMWNDYLAQVRPVINQLAFATKPGSVRHYLENYVKKLVYPDTGFLDSKWNSLVGYINSQVLQADILPYFMPRKAAAVYGKALYRGSLGPDTAIRNLTQTLHTWANSGTLPALTGIRDYLYGASMEKVGKIGLGKGAPEKFRDFKKNYDVVDEFLGMHLDKYYKSSPDAWDRVKWAGNLVTKVALFPMHLTENINKGIAYMAGLQEGIDKGLDFTTANLIGMSKASKFQNFNLQMSEAQWFGMNKMMESQYGYTTTHTSPYLQSVGMKFFTPFWSFPIKTFQFLSNGIKESFIAEDNARLVRFIALGGFMATAPAVLAEMFGIDASAIWGKGALPFQIYPAWLKGMSDVYTSLGGKDASHLDQERAQRAAKDIIGMFTVPEWRWGKKVVKNIEDLQRGYETWGPGEHPFNSINIGSVLAKLTGWPLYETKEARDMLKDLRDEEMKVYDKHQYVKKIADVMEKGKPNSMDEARKIIEEASAEGLRIRPQDIMSYRRMKQIDIYTYKLTRGQKAIRTGVWGERLREAREKYLHEKKYGTRPQWSAPKQTEEGEEE